MTWTIYRTQGMRGVMTAGAGLLGLGSLVLFAPTPLTMYQAKAKDKNQNSSHDTPEEAIEHAKDKVGDLGDDKITLTDEDGNVIGEKSADGKREWRIDRGHVNWKATEDGSTIGGHADWTNGEWVPNATDASEQYEWDPDGGMTQVGTPIGGRGE